MKRLLCALLTAFLLLAGSCPAALANTAYELTEGKYKPGEAVVLYDASVIPVAVNAVSAYSAQSNAPNTADPPFGAGIAVEKDFDFNIQSRKTRGGAAEPETSLHIALVSGAMNTSDLLDVLNAMDGVVAAEPNYAYTTAFNDPYYAYDHNLQWGLNGASGIHADDLWRRLESQSPDPIVIAVVDTGVDYDHPDLKNRLDESIAFDAHPSPGRRWGEEINNSGHGTIVSGIIAAETDNNMGIAGVAGENPVTIMPVQVFSNNTTAYASDIISGLHHILQQKKYYNVNVVAANMSLGGTWHSSVVTSYALEKLSDAGILPVRSAGNYAQDIVKNSVYPSVFEAPGVVGVAATNVDGTFDWSYFTSNSNYSKDCIALAAPGAFTLSTFLTGENGYLNTAAVGSRCDFFDDFDGGKTYDVIIDSGGATQRTVQLSPSSGGRAGGNCLRIELPGAEKRPYCVALPYDMIDTPAGSTLGMQVRVQCAQETSLDLYINNTFEVVRPTTATSDGVWQNLYRRANATQPMYLWLEPQSAGDYVGDCVILIDDFGRAGPGQAAYKDKDARGFALSGTSMAAPYVAGAYGLLCMAAPDMSFAERRARLIGSAVADSDGTLASKVNVGGSLNLTHTLDPDTTDFCPVIDSITQSGDTVTVEGWFFGDRPTLSFDGRTVPVTYQAGSNDDCTLTFTLPPDISGVQTLTLTKGNGRSYRMRYRYDDAGNMQEVCDGPAGGIRTVLFAQGEQLFALSSMPDGFAVYRFTGSGWESVGTLSGDSRTARTDFTYCVADGTLIIYDYDHVHCFDLSAKSWSTIPGPDTLRTSDTGYTVGAIARYNDSLMILGGSFYAGTRTYRNAPSVYDPVSGQWVVDQAYPDRLTLKAAQAVEVGGRLLLFAKDVSNNNKILLYDGALWQVRDAAYDVSGCTLAAFRGTVLAFGDGDAQQGILRYDPATDRWSRLPYWGTGLPYTAVGAVAGDYVYALTALQDHSKFILQRVKPPLPVPEPPAESYGDPFFVQATPTPTPTPTLIPVADVPRTGGAHRLWLTIPLLALLPLFWRYMERKRQ